MPYDLPPQETWPKPGYYYHYKHDPSGPVNNYAYYIYGIGHHTERDCRPQEKFFMNYLPLYDAHVAKMGKRIDNRVLDDRPLYMFFEPAAKDGQPVERFVRISDRTIIAELQKIKHEMYPPYPDE